MSNLDELRRELADVFGKAENAIKEYEIAPMDQPETEDVSALFVPAVNQLRYAGFHHVKAETLTEDCDKESNLKKAINHCKRAYFDVKEAMLLERLGSFEGFKKSYSSSPNLIEVYPTYADDHERVNQIRREIITLRQKIYVDRIELFDHIDPLLADLRAIASRVDALGPTVAAKDRKDSRNFLIIVAGLIITMTGVVCNFWGCNDNSPKSPPSQAENSPVVQQIEAGKAQDRTTITPVLPSS